MKNKKKKNMMTTYRQHGKNMYMKNIYMNDEKKKNKKAYRKNNENNMRKKIKKNNVMKMTIHNTNDMNGNLTTRQ